MSENKSSTKTYRKGFTLTELLTVIVILSIILIIAVPSTMNYVKKSKQKSFFASVSNIVNKIKVEKILSESNYCMYDYSKDKDNHTQLINSMYVLVHKEEDNVIYSVYAKSKEEKIDIDVYDFKSLNINDSKNWVQEKADQTYSYFITKLSGVISGANNLNELGKYSVCELK